MNSPVRPESNSPPGSDAAAPARNHGRMHLLMLGVTICWASNIVAGKEALRGFGALALAQLRLAGAALILGIIFVAWPQRPRIRLQMRQWLFLLWVALFGITLNQMFFIGGLSRTSVAHAGLIVALGPVMVLVLSCLMRLEALTALKFAGMVISFAGVGFLTMGDSGRGSGATLGGDLILLAGSAVFAYYTVMMKELAGRYGALTLNMLIFVMGAMMMMPFAGPAILHVRWTLVPSMAWWGLAFMVFFGSAAAYLIYAFALTELTAARVAAFAYLQPVIAAALGVWLLGESVTRREVIGGVLILLGVYLSERERGEERQVQSAAQSLA